MKLTVEQYEFIKEEVVALFERYDVRCIPINGFELAHKMGITLIPYTSLSKEEQAAAMKISIDGFYMENRQGKDIIYYNNKAPYKRTNMTILHEIGHCVLDHKGESAQEEAEANFFAKYAAAPPPLIDLIKPKDPKDIADMFDISQEAAIYAMDYYQKWLLYGRQKYTAYKIRLLTLFHVA
jgi:Zn-dependent peptidase ImmA (M78 family)